MRLSREQIKTITHGALNVTETDGYIQFQRFTEKERTALLNPNLDYPAGVQLIFYTDGTLLRLCGLTMEKTGVRSYYNFDIYENGKLIGTIANLKDEDAVGSYATLIYPLGEFGANFPLGMGKNSSVLSCPILY